MSAPQKSLRSLGGRPVWVPICSRRGVNGSASYYDSTSTAVMDQQACISPSWGTVTALKLVFAAFDMPPQGEIDRAVTATGTAALFVPGLNIVQATGNAGTPAGSTVLNTFAPAAFGTSGISLGQLLAAGGITPGTYVTAVSNSFSAGSGNSPSATSVTISAPTTAASWNGQAFTFSGLFVPVKFGGKRSFTVEPGHDVVTSDPVGAELPPSTWFLVRTAAAFSGTGLQLMDQPLLARLTVTTSAGAFQEFDSRGTTLNDQTMAPSYVSNTGGGYWGPVALLALVTPNVGQVLPGSALILGDSIAAGTGDAPDSLGLEGYIQRSFENNLPFVSAARGSTTALAMLNHGDGQYALSIDTGITDVMLAIGRNDIEQFSMTAAQVEANVLAIATRYSNAGKRAWCFTVPPTTYSNDAWTSLANQSFPFATYTTGAAATTAGATTIALTSVNLLTAGMSVGLNGSTNVPAQAIAPGTTIVSINGTASTITISPATSGTLAGGTKLYFGTATAGGSALETQRQAYNSFARANWRNGGGACTGLIDIDAVVADQGGSEKWRTDLGQASSDGVHPSAVLHQAAVNSGMLSPSRFSAP
jgi:lysophospholipase L1-like esterase